MIISIDTLRADHMGIYGYSKNTTPNIDKWAKEAFVFNDAYTVIPQTYPSFATLMTGKHPFSTQIYRNGGFPISENSTTLAKILKENGYSTAAFITNDYLTAKNTNLNSGFEHNVYNPAWNTRNIQYNNLLTDAFDWLTKNVNKKMFVWIHMVDPHAPYEPPDEFLCKTNEQMCPEIKKSSLAELDKKRLSMKSCQNEAISQYDNDLFQTLYDGEVIQTDIRVGSILKKLQELNLEKNTIVVFLADHGESFDHNYYFAHSIALYNSYVKIPLIIKHPLVQKDIKSQNQLIQITDIFPTVLKLLKVPDNNLRTDGISFHQLFANSTPIIPSNGRKNVVMENSVLSKFAISDGRYKYIYSYPYTKEEIKCLYRGQTEELYDLKTDPQELNNIAS